MPSWPVVWVARSTETVVTDIPEKKEAPAMPPGGGGMGGDF